MAGSRGWSSGLISSVIREFELSQKENDVRQSVFLAA